jgi:hypothetical protein
LLTVPWPALRDAAAAAPPQDAGPGVAAAASSVALAQATPAQLKQAFVFGNVVYFPASDLIWVQRNDSRRKNDLGDLVDSTGRWLGPSKFEYPDFTGDTRSGLFPARGENRLMGYIDGRGEWSIPPQFNNAGHYADGRAVVYVGPNERRTIDREGRFLPGEVPPKLPDPSAPRPVATTADGQTLDWVQPGHRGLASAFFHGKVGVLDARRQWHLQPTLEAALVNHDGTVLAQRNGASVFFDAAGHELPAARGYRTLGEPAEGLTPACRGLHCGYLAPGGDWAIAPRFESVATFSGGVSRVMLNGLVAYIDRSGRLITPEPPALAAAPFLWRPGRMHDAQTNNGGRVYGFIERSGKLVIPPVFSQADDFGTGLAPVQASNDALGYIDRQGRWKLPPGYRRARSFVDGLALVDACGPYANRWCHIDAQGHGQVALPDGIESAGPFENGRAWIRGYDGITKWVDRQGQPASAPQRETAPAELQRLSINGSPWGFADAEDRFVIAPRFDDAGEFSQGLAPVKLGELWGFVERSGKLAIAPAYDEVAPFSEGLARVRNGEGWRFIDRQGKPLATLPFVFVADFHEGLARVGMELETARRLAAGVPADAAKLPDFIGPVPPMLCEGGEFVRGLAWVKLVRGGTYAGDGMALMNAKGELIVPAPWTERPVRR